MSNTLTSKSSIIGLVWLVEKFPDVHRTSTWRIFLVLPSFLSSFPVRNSSFVFLCLAGELDQETLDTMSLPRCGVKDKVGKGVSARRKRYALQGNKSAFFSFFSFLPSPSNIPTRDSGISGFSWLWLSHAVWSKPEYYRIFSKLMSELRVSPYHVCPFWWSIAKWLHGVSDLIA